MNARHGAVLHRPQPGQPAATRPCTQTTVGRLVIIIVLLLLLLLLFIAHQHIVCGLKIEGKQCEWLRRRFT